MLLIVRNGWLCTSSILLCLLFTLLLLSSCRSESESDSGSNGDDGGSTGTITVTSPNAGENWIIGAVQTIGWTFNDAGSSVNIYLYKASQLSFTIASSTANDGSYSWTLPSSLTVGSNYKIKIVDSRNNAISDQSNGKFTISQAEGGGNGDGGNGGGDEADAQTFSGDYVGTLAIEVTVGQITLIDDSTPAEVEITGDGLMYLTFKDVTLGGIIDSDGNWKIEAAIEDFGELIDEESKDVLITEGCSLTEEFVEIEGQVTPPDMSGDVSGELSCTNGSLKIAGTLIAST